MRQTREGSGVGRALRAIGGVLGRNAGESTRGRDDAVASALPQPVPTESGRQFATLAEEGASATLLATLGHELRTPLAALMGYAELLACGDEPDPARRRVYAQMALSSARHLDDLVRTALDGGAAALVAPQGHAPLDLVSLVAECSEWVRLDARARGIRLRNLLDADGPAVAGDARALRQIVLNVLANAIRFTPAGGEIAIAVEAGVSDVTLSIVDTGVGMGAEDDAAPPDGEEADVDTCEVATSADPMDDVCSLIDLSVVRRERARMAACADGDAGDLAEFDLPPPLPVVTPAAGTGLGLAIVRSLARLQGGDVIIRSATGVGTEVRIVLPRAGAAEAGADPRSPTDTPPTDGVARA